MSLPEQPFGFVAGRWVRSIGDTPDDTDRAPDYVPVETGEVTFTPQLTHRVTPDDTGWAGIIKEKIRSRLGERGQLIDAEGNDHLALAVGVYSVSYNFGAGRSWPSHHIEVKAEHTADTPLWLPPAAPPPKGPMISTRVVKIPDGGEDGQVLVWDGVGFSWDFPPEGPRGPIGEVSAADLTTALEGKVTGEGMTLRHDTTVGERVFFDHPGGSTMIYGDTGWRDITDNLTNGWTAESIHVRRVNSTVYFRYSDLSSVDATSASSFRFPEGFVPSLTGTTVLVSRYESSSPAYMQVWANNVTIPVSYFSSPNRVGYGGVTSWETSRFWPTTLPGEPV